MKTWDGRIAEALVRPLSYTRVTPNHITGLSLVLGVTAGILFASGKGTLANLAAGLFMLSALVDHADGELARMTRQSTRFGHYFDFIVDFINYIALFTGIGLGLRHGMLGNSAVFMSLLICLSVSTIFTLRLLREHAHRNIHAQPGFAGFEIQDVTYLIGPLTWLGGLQPFFIAASIGTPLYTGWMLLQHRR
ncbi:MAG: CDP-alcohol phosphatidyltransferase family protein [Gammaproteobacteria bacterium]